MPTEIGSQPSEAVPARGRRVAALAILGFLVAGVVGLAAVALGAVTAAWVLPELESGRGLAIGVAGAWVTGGTLLVAGGLARARGRGPVEARGSAALGWLAAGWGVLALPALLLASLATWQGTAIPAAWDLGALAAAAALAAPAALALASLVGWARLRTQACGNARHVPVSFRSAALAALGLGLGALALAPDLSGRVDPRIGGRPLSAWDPDCWSNRLDTMYDGPPSLDACEAEAVQVCLAVIRAEAEPARLSRLARGAGRALAELPDRMLGTSPWTVVRRTRHTSEALTVLAQLGPRAAPAIPDIMRVLECAGCASPSEEAGPAGYCLGRIGPAARCGVPALLTRMRRDPSWAIGWLWAIAGIVRPPAAPLTEAEAELPRWWARRFKPAYRPEAGAVEPWGIRLHPPEKRPEIAAWLVLAVGAPTLDERREAIGQLVKFIGTGYADTTFASESLKSLTGEAASGAAEAASKELDPWLRDRSDCVADGAVSIPADFVADDLWAVLEAADADDRILASLIARGLASPHEPARARATESLLLRDVASDAIREALWRMLEGADRTDAARAAVALAALGSTRPLSVGEAARVLETWATCPTGTRGFPGIGHSFFGRWCTTWPPSRADAGVVSLIAVATRHDDPRLKVAAARVVVGFVATAARQFAVDASQAWLHPDPGGLGVTRFTYFVR